MADNGSYSAEVNSKLEPILIERICRPVLERVPESVHPNSISLVNHVVAWSIALLAVSSSRLGGLGQAVTLVLAGLFSFVSMVLDNLDGMQARRTDRCSKLGEMMDHWLDSVHVPLVTVGLTMALQLDPWAVAAVHVTNTMIYNAQLVLYHHKGSFVHPPTAGTDAQFGVAIGYVIGALVFALIPRQLYWLDLSLAVAAAAAVFVHARQLLFYYQRLKRQVVHHLPFVALCGGFAALYLVGAISALTFVLAVTFVSFRITGSYVLHTIIGRRYIGFDWGIALFIVLIAAAALVVEAPLSLGGLSMAWLLEPHSLRGYSFTVASTLPYLAFLYMVARNLMDFALHFSELRPGGPAREKEELA